MTTVLESAMVELFIASRLELIVCNINNGVEFLSDRYVNLRNAASSAIVVQPSHVEVFAPEEA